MTILGIDPGTRKMGYAIISLENRKVTLIEAGLITIKQDELQFQIPQMVEAF
jgi:crossover junction endodeoxyribonuclease RuvC